MDALNYFLHNINSLKKEVVTWKNSILKKRELNKKYLNWTYGHRLQVSQFCDHDRSFFFNTLSCSHTKEHGHGSVARAGGVPERISSIRILEDHVLHTNITTSVSAAGLWDLHKVRLAKILHDHDLIVILFFIRKILIHLCSVQRSDTPCST